MCYLLNYRCSTCRDCIQTGDNPSANLPTHETCHEKDCTFWCQWTDYSHLCETCIGKRTSQQQVPQSSMTPAPNSNGQGTAGNDDSVRQKVPLTQQQLLSQYKAQGRELRNESVRLGGKRFRDEALTEEEHSGELEAQNQKGREGSKRKV
ncbi:hypothetical protein HYFRA_00013541 [Hymenoscyphus fraxineus]|uniref:Uncharacterized protein n=1 Tax=Hymenoscyphus fraxineus TaxID=746836 RepID=A0A9N9LAS3_9HELO|nr:hypothetical protein HYFRA_00013541 [Hymenoscyphus fraxineus]